EVRHPLFDRFFVNDRRLVDRDALDGGLLLVVDTDVREGDAPPSGELIADVTLADGDDPTFDRAAHRTLVASAADAEELRLTPGAERRLAAMDEAERVLVLAVLESVLDDPDLALRNPAVLALLQDLPTAEPAFEPAAVQRVIDTADEVDPQAIHRLRLYRLDRDETL